MSEGYLHRHPSLHLEMGIDPVGKSINHSLKISKKMADFPRIEFNGDDAEMQPVNANNSVLTPLTKPMDFGKFLDVYNKGEELEMETTNTDKETLVGYVEHVDKTTNRSIVLTVWAPKNIDETKPIQAQLCKDDKGRRIVFLRNRSENVRKFGKPVAAQEKKA